jgi:serine/threonine-protein kinase
VTLGDYRLIRRLGHGAMGHVYKARQLSLDRDVAVKVLYPHMARNRVFRKRFLREARVMGKLSHPHVVHCYGVGKAQGRYYLAMEYVEGRSLHEWLMRLGRLRAGDALHVVLACAGALQHAHSLGLVHRDIKPDNVLVGRDGCVKLADLGLAKALDDDLNVTQTGHGAGTPVYMAPEQARNAKHVDHRSDLYALGVMLYQLLTGELPFAGSTVLEIVLAKLEGRYEPARRLNPEVPARLDAIIARLLARFPEDRYQGCADLIRDLTALGLAHPELSFLPPAEATATSPVLPPLTVTDMAETASGRWHVIHRRGDGRWVSREMTTKEVGEEAAADEDFARTAQASRTSPGEFRALGCFPEFEAALKARRRRAKAERQAAVLAAQADQVAAAERSRRRWGWLRRLGRWLAGRT